MTTTAMSRWARQRKIGWNYDAVIEALAPYQRGTEMTTAEIAGLLGIRPGRALDLLHAACADSKVTLTYPSSGSGPS